MELIEQFWIWYREAKAASETGDHALLLERLQALAVLPDNVRQMPMAANVMGWLIHRHVKRQLEARPVRYDRAVAVLPFAHGYPQDPDAVPSALVVLLMDAMKVREHFPGLNEWIRQWPLERLPATAWVPYETPDGKKLMPVAEQAWLKRAKALTEAARHAEADTEAEMLHNLAQLQALTEAHPEAKYVRYGYTLLLVAMGRIEQAREAWLGVIAQNQRAFWTWSGLGKTLAEQEPALAVACLAQALLCPDAREDYTVRVRSQLLTLLRQPTLPTRAELEVLAAPARALVKVQQAQLRRAGQPVRQVYAVVTDIREGFVHYALHEGGGRFPEHLLPSPLEWYSEPGYHLLHFLVLEVSDRNLPDGRKALRVEQVTLWQEAGMPQPFMPDGGEVFRRGNASFMDHVYVPQAMLARQGVPDGAYINLISVPDPRPGKPYARRCVLLLGWLPERPIPQDDDWEETE